MSIYHDRSARLLLSHLPIMSLRRVCVVRTLSLRARVSTSARRLQSQLGLLHMASLVTGPGWVPRMCTHLVEVLGQARGRTCWVISANLSLLLHTLRWLSRAGEPFWRQCTRRPVPAMGLHCLLAHNTTSDQACGRRHQGICELVDMSGLLDICQRNCSSCSKINAAGYRWCTCSWPCPLWCDFDTLWVLCYWASERVHYRYFWLDFLTL